MSLAAEHPWSALALQPDARGMLAVVTGWVVALLALGIFARERARLHGARVIVAESAHELRGAVCGVRLALDTLTRAVGPSPVAVMRPEDAAARLVPGVEAVDAELRRAALIVDDMQACLTTPRRAGTTGSIDVNRLLERTAPALEPLVRVHGGTLSLVVSADAPMVRADGPRMWQAIRNLVANAAEHGGRHVTVTVRVQGGRVRLEVHDDGPGLPSEVLRSLEACSRHRVSRGSWSARRGHGLAIVARVASEAGGRLRALPADRGARLVLDLPAAADGPVPPRWFRGRPTEPALRWSLPGLPQR